MLRRRRAGRCSPVGWALGDVLQVTSDPFRVHGVRLPSHLRSEIHAPWSLQTEEGQHPQRPFLGGADDFNVPLVGSEQMYQALRSLGVDTQLVIYPGQFHGLTTPSYKVDRLKRYLAWYDKYLKVRKQSTEDR